MGKEILFQKYIRKSFSEVIRVFERQNPKFRKIFDFRSGSVIYVKPEPVIIDGIGSKKKLMKYKFTPEGNPKGIHTFLESYWEWEPLE